MTRAFEKIMAGAEEVVALAERRLEAGRFAVHAPGGVDVRAIRRRARLTQQAFASRYGFSVGAVRDWEQGRKQPEAAARVLLTVIAREPAAVERALSAA